MYIFEWIIRNIIHLNNIHYFNIRICLMNFLYNFFYNYCNLVNFCFNLYILNNFLKYFHMLSTIYRIQHIYFILLNLILTFIITIKFINKILLYKYYKSGEFYLYQNKIYNSDMIVISRKQLVFPINISKNNMVHNKDDMDLHLSININL